MDAADGKPVLHDGETVTLLPENDPRVVKIDDPYRKIAGSTVPAEGPGSGGLQDFAMIRRAVIERWPMSAEMREKVPKTLLDIVMNARDPRARVRAAQVLAIFDKLNMEAEQQAATGGIQRVDITSGGKPLGADLGKLSQEELDARIRALEGGST